MSETLTATALDSPGASLLVIDDSPTVLRVMEGVLNHAGYRVTCLESGTNVLETAREIRPELIFVDFAMPDISGYEVCRRLGQHPELQNIPVVIMSTRGDAVGERFVRAMGIVDHITKPFAPEALLALVEHVLAKSRSESLDERRQRREHDEALRSGGQVTFARMRLSSLLSQATGERVTADELLPLVTQALDSDPSLLRDLRLAIAEHPTAPALAGVLSTVPIGEVLQLLALQRQSGFLHVYKGITTVSLAFKDGSVRLVTGENIPSELLLGTILVRERLIDPSDLEALLANRHGTTRRLGAQVVQLGYVDRDQLHRVLRRQSAELVYEIIRWGAGTFEFERCAALPAEVLEFEFGLGIDELLMEGFRRVDEWGLIESVLPSLDAVVQLVPGGIETLGAATLQPEELHLLRWVDGRRTADQVIAEAGQGRFAGARILYRLLSTRVVTTRGPEISVTTGLVTARS